MQSDMFVFKIDGGTATRMRPEALESLRILETTHLEQWIVNHPEVLGEDVKIVTTQYDNWSSDSGDLAKERLDILALDSTGQTIVVELKRSSDSRIHLQAITYASLVAGFGKTTLAEAHADYLNRRAIGDPVVTSVSADEARAGLAAHVHGDWDPDILTQPKIILIAESFTAQTYTTVQWLTDMAPNIAIEMHTVNAFVLPDAGSCVVFRRLYPAVDPATRVLTPGLITAADETATKIAERKVSVRSGRSTHILYDNDVIPNGARVDLRLRTYINADIVDEVDDWIADNPERGTATWVRNRERPLRWRADSDPERTWQPTTLAKTIVEEATGRRMDAIPGGDVWHYNEHSLYALAKSIDAELASS